MLKFLLSLCIVAVSQILGADVDPRSMYAFSWYRIEIIVFEPTKPVFSREALIHIAERQSVPKLNRSLGFSDEEFTLLFDFETDDIVGKTALGETFLRVSGLQDPDITKDHNVETFELTNSSSCWLHRSNQLLSDSQESQTLESTRKQPEHNTTERITPIQKGELVRDKRLPNWFPASWQDLTWNILETGKHFGLCMEEMSLLSQTNLEKLLQLQGLNHTIVDNSEQASVTFDIDDVREAFSDHENLLIREAYLPTSGHRLTGITNRLEENKYRIIGHATWHQDAPPVDVANEIFVEFGGFHSNGLREVEGTLSLNLARFLHLQVRLRKFTEEPDQFDREKYDFKTPLFYYEMQESRRLALGEVHYFDHPWFGVLVRVQRVAIPDTLTDLLQRFDSAN